MIWIFDLAMPACLDRSGQEPVELPLQFGQAAPDFIPRLFPNFGGDGRALRRRRRRQWSVRGAESDQTSVKALGQVHTNPRERFDRTVNIEVQED